jgi:hypothetical protein
MHFGRLPAAGKVEKIRSVIGFYVIPWIALFPSSAWEHNLNLHFPTSVRRLQG